MAATMCNVPPVARVSARARRKARSAPSESAAPTTTRSNTGIARRVRPLLVAVEVGHQSVVPLPFGRWRGRHQDGQVGGAHDLFPEAGSNAVTGEPRALHAEDDEVGAEALRR